MCEETDVWMETYQARDQDPVTRECTIEIERFFHFQDFKSSCFTTLGTGKLCSNRWINLKIRAHTSTDLPGWLFTTGTRTSILSSSSLPRSLSLGVCSYSLLLPNFVFSPRLDVPRVCKRLLDRFCAVRYGSVLQDRGGAAAAASDDLLFLINKV